MNIWEKTEKKVFSFMEENHMVDPGEQVVVGVSGGADSVCLLFLLLEYQKKMPFEIQVVHIHHGIRTEAEEDAKFVEDLCQKAEVSYVCRRVDVPGLAAAKKVSTETAGRQARYETFYEIAKEKGATKIAVAHNTNDNAETVLFHLFRGSGIGGLAGMSPMRKGEDDNYIIRPILCLEREEIESYLTDRGIPWCTDSTNDSDDYTRNRIRHHIIPYAEEKIVQGAVEHVAQSAQSLREAEEYLSQQTESAIQMVSVGRGRLDCSRLSQHPEIIQKRVLFAAAKEFSPTGKDIGQIHVKDMMSLIQKEENRSIHLPFGIVVSRRYGEIVFEVDTLSSKEECHLQQALNLDLSEGSFVLPGLGTLEIRKFNAKEAGEIPRNRYTKWLDCGKIIQSLEIRHRSEGDFLCIRNADGEMKHKTLKQYMIDEKIPKQERDRIPILADGSHVLWVVGGRISEEFKVTENTNTILEVKLIRNDCEMQ